LPEINAKEQRRVGGEATIKPKIDISKEEKIDRPKKNFRDQIKAKEKACGGVSRGGELRQSRPCNVEGKKDPNG